MRFWILVVSIFSAFNHLYAQPVYTAHKDTLRSEDRAFTVKFSTSDKRHTLSAGSRDTIDYGMDGRRGASITAWIGKDSITIQNSSFPYFQVHYIPIVLAGKPYIFRWHFNDVRGYFTKDYITEHDGKVQIIVPEVFELANVILALSPAGRKATNIRKEGDYYNEVMTYFKPFQDHPLFKKLNFESAAYMKSYYEFRENSICFNFEGDKLVGSENYFFIYGSDDSTYSNLFSNNRTEIADFAKTSGFRDFYKKHTRYYEELISEERQMMDAEDMWSWLEKEFPRPKFRSYKVIFSPLILASHSTQRFAVWDFQAEQRFQECVMFVSGPEIYDTRKELSEMQKSGFVSGIVFTEIDHNYVNERSHDYEESIDSIFSKRALWVDPKQETGYYGSPVGVFNEYMTHALFCLYALGRFEPQTAAFLIAAREQLMVSHRGFTEFPAFNKALVSLKKEHPSSNVYALYPRMLDWCRKFAARPSH